MRACIIIPARYSSTRYPGKPLVPLLGKAMILWVAELAAKCVGQAHVYIATDDERIASVVEDAGFNVLLTSNTAATGTDRLAEAALMVDYDLYINVQGDEPLIKPEDIAKVIAKKEENMGSIVNGYCWMAADENPDSRDIPKVVASEDDTLLYMSRAAIPSYKDQSCAPARYKKQVCIYAFTKAELQAFAGFGRKGVVERHEDIEILRFFELGSKIILVETQPGSLAVDSPSDVANVERALQNLHKT
ncbi:MAG: 3-deoxy-manno-octulosonate cytidylyltransferase [Rhodobacteraceae bacterium]|nr:3-deoxy-manno-octulosonate cytidylyltransferase [Paracoccaceae bacterium]